MKAIYFSVLAFFLILLVSCDYGIQEFLYRGNRTEERASEIHKLPEISVKLNSRNQYRILVLSDIHFGKKGERKTRELFSAIDKMEEKPEFAVCLGDIADHGKKSEFQEYKKFAEELETHISGKIYSCPGNHDLYNSGWNHFKEFVFPSDITKSSAYSFRVNGKMTFYILDSASGSIGFSQYENFKEKVQSDSTRKILFSHYPFYVGSSKLGYFCLQNMNEVSLLIDLCSKNNFAAAIFGHAHINMTTDFGNFYQRIYPSFLESGEYGILTVDENAMSVKSEVFSL